MLKSIFISFQQHQITHLLKFNKNIQPCQISQPQQYLITLFILTTKPIPTYQNLPIYFIQITNIHQISLK